MKTGIYKPFVKDVELWGKEVNPLGEKAFLDGHFYPQSISFQIKHQAKWDEAEQSLQSFKVDESEYFEEDGDIFVKFESEKLADYILIGSIATFRATLKDNTLINLEVL